MTTESVEHMPISRTFSEESIKTLTEDEQATISEYLSHFAVFDDTLMRCRCGRKLRLPGTMESIFGNSSFTWGLVHGEGYCGDCEWPARAVHSVDVGREHPLVFRVPLPYHPDFVESRGDA